MINQLMLLMMLFSVLLAVRAAEIAAERIYSSFTVAAGWIGLSVAAFMLLFVQWVAYVQLPWGSGL